MTPKAHSIERVSVDNSVNGKLSEFAKRLNDAIELYKNGDKNRAEEIQTNVVIEFFEWHNYGATGSSNSIWGRQERVSLLNSASKNNTDRTEMIDQSRKLGFINQNYTDSNRPYDAHIFVPSLDRYISINHQTNHKQTDIAIVKHTDMGGNIEEIEVAGCDKALNVLERETYVNENRRQNGVLYYDYDDTKFLENNLESNNISYSIYNGWTGRIPEYEWCPETDINVILYSEHTGYSRNYNAHLAENQNKTCCGSKNVGREENMNIILPVTYNKLSKYGDYEECGHIACQSKMP